MQSKAAVKHTIKDLMVQINVTTYLERFHMKTVNLSITLTYAKKPGKIIKKHSNKNNQKKQLGFHSYQ